MQLSLLRRRGASKIQRLIGHVSLGRGESFQHGSSRYISVDEAIYRQGRGYEVTIRFESTPEDDAALAAYREESLAKLARLRAVSAHLRRPPAHPSSLNQPPADDAGIHYSEESAQ